MATLAEGLDLLFARTQRLFLSLVPTALAVLALVVGGAALEAAHGAVSARRAAMRGALVLRPRGESAAGLMAQAERLPGVAGVAGCLCIPYGDGALQEINWPQGRVWAVRTALEGARFAPPAPGLGLAAGRYPQSLDEALVGHELARALGLEVGSTIWVAERPFTVAGIWRPAGLAAGHVVQLPYEAAALLYPGAALQLDPIYVFLEAGAAAETVRQDLVARLAGAVVLTPEAFWAEEERLLRALALIGAALLALTALASAPAATQPLRPLSPHRLRTAALAALVGLLGAAFGLCLGWGAVLVANDHAARTYALTPLRLTPRLAGLALGWPALSAALGGGLARRGRAGELGRLWRGAVASGAVALAVALWLLVGALGESLQLALERTQAGNAGRLGVVSAGGRLSDAILGQLAHLAGYQGAIVEAPGGALEESEDGWPGRPPSGLLYGLLAADGASTGLEVPWPTRLAVGRGLQGRDEVIVGWGLAQSRGLQPGAVISIRGRDFTVVGVRERWPYEALSPVNWRADVTLQALRDLLAEPDLFGRVTVLVPPARQEAQRAAYLAQAERQMPDLRLTGAESEMARVAGAFPGGRTLAPVQPADYARGLYGRLAVVAGVLALLIAGLAVENALYPVYLEQKSEIELQKLLGAGPGHILASYLWSGLAVAGLGALLGGYSACVWSGALNACFAGSLAWAPLVVSPRLLAGAGLLTVLVGTLFACGPGLAAAAVDPARLLGGAGPS